MFFHSESHSTVERTRITGSVSDTAEIGEWGRSCARVNHSVAVQRRWDLKASASAIGVFETGQVHPHTPIEVHIGRHVLHKLLFECNIYCINPRVRIVLVEYGHPRLERECVWRKDGWN